MKCEKQMVKDMKTVYRANRPILNLRFEMKIPPLPRMKNAKLQAMKCLRVELKCYNDRLVILVLFVLLLI